MRFSGTFWRSVRELGWSLVGWLRFTGALLWEFAILGGKVFRGRVKVWVDKNFEGTANSKCIVTMEHQNSCSICVYQRFIESLSNVYPKRDPLPQPPPPIPNSPPDL
jgi:hypothetical protein